MGTRSGAPVLYKRPGSSIWWCRFTAHGKQHFKSTGTGDPREAETAAALLQAQAVIEAPRVERQRPPKRDERALDVIFAEYIGWAESQGKAKTYTRQMESHFRAHIRPRFEYLYQFTGPAIEEYAQERQAEGASLVTVSSEQVTINRFLKWCATPGRKLIQIAPQFERVRPISDYQPPNLSPDDVRRLIAELPTRETHPKHYAAREFFMVLWSMALRVNQLRTLRWSDIDLPGGVITIRQSKEKGRKRQRSARALPIAAAAREALAKMATLEHAPDALVFGPWDLRVTLEKAAERAGIPKVHHHALKHARISEYASITHDTAAIQHLAQHASLSTTEIYIRSRLSRATTVMETADAKQAEKDKAAAALPRIGRGKTGGIQDRAEHPPKKKARR